MFQLDPYDGTTDLLNYLKYYKAFMRIQGATDVLLCLAFLVTLCKAVHDIPDSS